MVVERDNMSIHSYNVALNNEQSLDLAQYSNNAVLIVNTATFCGFTPQYEGLQSLHERYYEKGLRVIAFPCNQFGGQEPREDAEIKDFCEKTYNITFPVSKKIDVNGPNAHPLYKYLVEETGSNIAWNFEKFLVDKNGKITRLSPDTDIDAVEVYIKEVVDVL